MSQLHNRADVWISCDNVQVMVGGKIITLNGLSRLGEPRKRGKFRDRYDLSSKHLLGEKLFYPEHKVVGSSPGLAAGDHSNGINTNGAYTSDTGWLTVLLVVVPREQGMLGVLPQSHNLGWWPIVPDK
ncbi:Hypp3892 [Branchiostoma lanceolatum]|uniref:Hypp3892 protein n=1 Tax=Branchiostoma lanceolatum TaxID=7740 RepID=A0A8K0A8Y2_BRALA|nr:Hypp3892 [Branchiostoma lanceolatum]